MKIVILGLSITSSWGNGHATTYRSLAKGLYDRGHKVVFFERDQEWYASNRDMPEPPFCKVHIYERWSDIIPLLQRELNDCDVAIVGSYFPDSHMAIEEVLRSQAEVKAFYDIDTPITVAKLRQHDAEYLRADRIPEFDIYFSFTGGPLLAQLESEYGAQRAVPLYCSFDADKYRAYPVDSRFACDLSYMGTYAPDRQPKLEEFFCRTAEVLTDKRFVLAGPQYPKSIQWPENVRRFIHLEPRFHPALYSSSRLTLNLTRAEMVNAGFSPSVRLFEASGCGATTISDSWPGIETFFEPGREILIVHSGKEVISWVQEAESDEIRNIGRRAQERVLAEHNSGQRAAQFEEYIANVGRRAQPIVK
jgi:spore maturation protein CgeB